MVFLRLLKYLWTLPNTLLGLLFIPIALLSGGKVQWVQGVVEIHGRAISWLLQRRVFVIGGKQALTLGHVVLGRDKTALTQLRDHEKVHVRQYECWGPFFIPVYFLASLLAFLQGGDAYRDNAFERAAYNQGRDKVEQSDTTECICEKAGNQ